MLNVRIKTAFVLSEILILIIYGSFSLIVCGIFFSGSRNSSFFNLPISDDKISFLFILSFIFLSGFVISVTVVGFVATRMNWIKRSLLNGLLFIVHVIFFLTIFGNDYSIFDFFFILIGIIVIALAEITLNSLWRERLKAS